ncbi:MAG: hypothetical protein JWN66_1718 [Sphingomonas bacterium]|uniref:alpha/beta hydrolase family protein n=1 Tax=Sphingomonas bacterium TaxID=1895847 RepID=UPI00260E0C4B|nr:S9 family peptidase [Sphingomonas bacterium]MDB5704602.1 hypothetical protein [Sphingomonas bacterium]
MRRIVTGAIALMLVAGVPAAARTPPPTQALPAPQPSVVKLLPIETFAEEPFIADPVLSPDGKEIAAESTVGGKTSLYVFAIADMKLVRRVDLGDATIAAIRWAGPTRLLLTVSTKTKFFGSDIEVTQLHEVDAAKGETKVLNPAGLSLFASDIIYVDPAGGWILLSAQDLFFTPPSVKRIDLATGTITIVEKQRPNVWSWFADGTGMVRAGVSYDGDRWTIWYRDTPGAPLKAVRARSAVKNNDGAIDGMWFLGGADTGLIVTNAKTGRFAAYKIDFRTGEIGDAIYENDQVDVTGAIVDPVNRTIAGIAYEDDRRRVAWLDPEKRDLQARIDHVFPGAENNVVNSSADGNRVLIWSGSADDPGTYYVFDRAAKKMQRIVSPYEKLIGVKLSPVRPIRYTARDGLSIPGYLTLPRDRPGRDLPLIVMPHGGPFARDSWDYDRDVQFLASRGYAVLQPQFRGSTGYGKDYVSRGYGQFGRAMQDDLDDGMDWLVKAGTVDPKRVCIMGGSYGGYAALWGAIRNPERYRCAVSMAGVTDPPGILRYDRRTFSATRYFKAWQRKVKGENEADLASVSPLLQADRLTVPVFIVHGEKDFTVPVKQGHQMVAALERRKAAVESVFYPDEGHGLRKHDDIADFLKRLDAFLAKNNPA